MSFPVKSLQQLPIEFGVLDQFPEKKLKIFHVRENGYQFFQERDQEGMGCFKLSLNRNRLFLGITRIAHRPIQPYTPRIVGPPFSQKPDSETEAARRHGLI